MTDDFYYNVEYYKRGLFDLICFEDKITKQVFSPHPKQIQAMELMNDNIVTQVGYGGSARGGKRLILDDLALTTKGFKRHGDLTLDDILINPDGSHQDILQLHPITNEVGYKITFSNGAIVTAHSEHLWYGGYRRDRGNDYLASWDNEKCIKTTKDIYDYFEKTKDKPKKRRFCVPIPLAADFKNNTKLKIDPYLLGHLLGNGTLTEKSGVKISCHEDDYDFINNYIESIGFNSKKVEFEKKLTDIKFFGKSKETLKKHLDFYNLTDTKSLTKFIPEDYKFASIEDRKQLLAGLLDSDGTVDKDGKVVYDSISKDLANDVVWIARSLGYFSTVRLRKARDRCQNGKVYKCKPCYNVYIRSMNNKELFNLKRKSDRIKCKQKQYLSNAVINIEKTEPQEMRCITVSNPNGLYITNDFIVTHNSALIALDSILCAYAYPECQNIIGRKSLVTLFETTWITLLRTLGNFGFELGRDYRYDGNRHTLTFENNSVIIAKNLEYKPSDKEGTEYGSLEILRAYIDQSEHVALKIVDKITERAGSHYTSSHFGIKGKVFEAFNPSTSHTKKRYWVPFKTEMETDSRKFVRALPSDNPGIEAKKWVEDQKKNFRDGLMSKMEYQKQIEGNFDYDDNPNKLCDYDTIVAMFENNQAKQNDSYYITADIARLGSDYARILVWKDWEVVEVISFEKSRTTEIKEAILALRTRYNIPKYKCIADEDGVGGGVVDECRIKGFVNNSSPIYEDTDDDEDDYTKKDKPQYKNLQTQCIYILARIINNHSVFISADISEKEQQEIIEEIEQVQSWNIDDDGKLQIKPKAKIKEDIGRSPDWRDALMMRSYFYLKDYDEPDIAVAVVEK